MIAEETQNYFSLPRHRVTAAWTLTDYLDAEDFKIFRPLFVANS
jgi:hypothetical protein